MSTGLEHRACAESLGAYVLGALTETESSQVEAHLASCRECQAEFEWLRVAADALPGSVPQIDPSPELKARIMTVVNGEAELLRAAGSAADRPEARPRRHSWWPFQSFSWWPAAAVAALGALAAVVVVAADGGGPRTVAVHVASRALPGARASLVLRGTHAELVVNGLRAPAANHVDEVWIKRGSATPQPAGTFVVRSGSVEVTRPVRPGDQVLVTVEPGRGTRAPTTRPLLVAHV